LSTSWIQEQKSVRLEQITGALKRPALRNHQPGQIPRAVLFSDHDQGT
jgi:hypothetical protein